MGSTSGPWQVDYQLTALAFGILTGHADWAPFYLWLLGNLIARTNGTSGYPPGYGTAYYMKANPAGWAAAFAALISDPDGNLKQAQYDSLKSDPYNGGIAMTGHEYIMTTRAALIMAARLEKLGLVNVRAVYPELDKCIATVDRMVRAGGAMNARTSVVIG